MSGSEWGLTPQQSIGLECARRGKDAVITGCIRLIYGDDVDSALIMALAGPAARRLLDGEPHDDLYWLRVWGTRGLLWAWDDSATGAVLLALTDEAWRVREMAAKVVARHLVGDALTVVAALRDDPVPRVRAVAARAVTRLTGAAA
ncbi:hypothetical protein F4553_001590 [Allocatelliglobosispora scoriae]|uniref:HEAT repeat domain-containing protein n=1 Tax=Allocatelliglobosispora scoriae TaxID=643052 RepID=A0A841BMZ5_9ACTN|nr:hypothetical protein [Allocatelliglobosispora scoriae]MBB5868211.1 hypothetical protein [Allocatelliglobosispora scoriae]